MAYQFSYFITFFFLWRFSHRLALSSFFNFSSIVFNDSLSSLFLFFFFSCVLFLPSPLLVNTLLSFRVFHVAYSSCFFFFLLFTLSFLLSPSLIIAHSLSLIIYCRFYLSLFFLSLPYSSLSSLLSFFLFPLLSHLTLSLSSLSCLFSLSFPLIG